MHIVQGTLSDAADIFEIFQAANKHLQEQGIHQWNDEYPNLHLIRSDIEQSSLYGIVADGRWVASVTLNEHQHAEWGDVNWQATEGKTICIHRLVVHPELQGRGYGKKLLQFADEYARTHGYSSIRLDAYSANQGALMLYEKAGYERREEKVYFPTFEMAYFCFEKPILSSFTQTVVI